MKKKSLEANPIEGIGTNARLDGIVITVNSRWYRDWQSEMCVIGVDIYVEGIDNLNKNLCFKQ